MQANKLIYFERHQYNITKSLFVCFITRRYYKKLSTLYLRSHKKAITLKEFKD